MTGSKASLVNIVGSGLAASISALAVIALSRSLGPTDFGIFSVGLALSLFILRLTDLGMGQVLVKYLPLHQDKKEATRIFSVSNSIRLLSTLALSSGILVFSARLSVELGLTGVLVLRIAVIGNLVTVLFDQFSAALYGLHRYYAAISLNIVQAVVKLSLVVAVVLGVTLTPESALLWYLTAPLVSVLVAALLLPQSVNGWLTKKLNPTWHEVRSFALNNYVAGIALVIVLNIELLLVNKLLGAELAGIVAAGSKIALFISMIGVSLGSVLNTRTPQYQQMRDLMSFYKKSWIILGLSLLGAVVSIVLTKPLLLLISGPAFIPGLLTAQLLVLAAWLAIATTPFFAFFYSFHKPWFFSLSALLQAGIIIVGNVLLIPLLGIVSVGWVRLGSQAVILLLTMSVVSLTLFFKQKAGREMGGRVHSFY